MFKRVLCILPVMLALSGLAYGDTPNEKTKYNSFEPVGLENPTADGSALLHYKGASDQTDFQIMLDDFTPNTTYDYLLVSPTMGEAAGCDVIVVDARGRGHFKGTISGNWADAEIAIFLSDDCTFTEEELRAVSQNE
jgi:hypothetical protein